jgi:hypothetical protein
MCRKPLWKEGTLYVPCKKQKKRMFQADRATLVSGSLYIERNPPVAASRYFVYVSKLLFGCMF